jgi:hypothetical protein
MLKVWNDLYSSTDKYTDGWLSSGIVIHTSLLFPLGNVSYC